MEGIVMRILITGARAPVALHLTRCLAYAGHSVVLADSLRFPLARASRFAQAFAPLPPAHTSPKAYAAAVTEVVERHGIELILPTCEEVFYLAAARDLFGYSLPLLAPPFDRLAEVHNKYRFCQISQGFGADAAETRLLTSSDGARTFRSPADWVFKPVWSRFGDRVRVQPETLDDLCPTPDDPWIAQRYLPGEELCVYAVAHHGQVSALQAYRPLYRAGRGIGAGVMVAPVPEPVIDQFVTGFVRHMNWTGQISFDFRRDGSGKIHVLECNPRATSGAHFFRPEDNLANALIEGHPATAGGDQPMGVPLAMLIYGLPDSLRRGQFGPWWRDFTAMNHLLEHASDRSTRPWQVLALIEATVRAVRSGQGLKAAATADIEWNGAPLL
jgi:hypothetical protein